MEIDGVSWKFPKLEITFLISRINKNKNTTIFFIQDVGCNKQVAIFLFSYITSIF